MSMLGNQAVNPLNTPQWVATNESVTTETQEFALADEVFAVPETPEVPQRQVMPGVLRQLAEASQQLVLPTPYQPPAGDGFDELNAGFGAFPTVKLDGGQFSIEQQTMGTEFEANILSIKKLFIWQLEDGDHQHDNQFVRSYDNLSTTCGRSLRDVMLAWQAKGHRPKQREMTEALTEIQSGVWQGQLVTLSIPPRSASRLAAYAEVLQRRNRLRVPEVITRISVGDLITTKTGVFHHWTFEFLQEVPRQ